jgi:hypothetical protein
MTLKRKQSASHSMTMGLTMDRAFNKVQNKNEYLFSDKEILQIVQFLIDQKFKWIKGINMFQLETPYKSTQIEIHIATCAIIIHNNKEVSKLVLDRKTYLDLVMGIQNMVVQG